MNISAFPEFMQVKKAILFPFVIILNEENEKKNLGATNQ